MDSSFHSTADSMSRKPIRAHGDACSVQFCTGAESVARALKAGGVSRIFGLCGDQVNALYHAWGTEKRLQRVSHGSDVACDLPAIRYDQFAAPQGVRGLYASTQEELPAAIAELIACDGPCLLNVELLQLAGRPYAGTPT
jgi:thiamine pyrophosphate-dependent acetolactate synthase large subunit-like protein